MKLPSPANIFIAVLLASGACSKKSDPASAPTPAPAPDVAPTPASVPDPAPAPTVLPALYAPLFTEEPVKFTWIFEVDTHDEEGSVARVSAEVTCRATLKMVGDAKIATVGCDVASKQGELESPPVLEVTWVATVDGLWMAPSLPNDAAELAEVLRGEPFLAAKPRAFTDERKGDPDRDIAASSLSVAQDGERWCRTLTIAGTYGSNMDRWCFAAGRGLVSVEITGREGPSTETYTRL